MITESPEEHFDEDGFGERNQSTWRKVTMLHHRRDGTVIEMELLRPAEWLTQAGIEAGRVIDLRFAELETAGYARVLGVSDCPPIQDGEGRVVIGRFVSRAVGSLLRGTLTDGSVFTGTANHPVWSVDAGDWKPLDEFSLGKNLLGIDGPMSIASVTPVRQAADVFNIEVDGEHVYRIVMAGILVDNADYGTVSLFRGGSGLLARIGIDVHPSLADGLIHPKWKGKFQGLSVNVDPKDVNVQKHGDAFPIERVPDGLQVVQQGKPGHFIIAPKTPMTLDRFNELFSQIILGSVNRAS